MAPTNELRPLDALYICDQFTLWERSHVKTVIHHTLYKRKSLFQKKINNHICINVKCISKSGKD